VDELMDVLIRFAMGMGLTVCLFLLVFVIGMFCGVFRSLFADRRFRVDLERWAKVHGHTPKDGETTNAFRSRIRRYMAESFDA